MSATIDFYPVGSGDMTLIRLASGKTILIDIHIRQKADSESEDDYSDAASMLKDVLDRDGDGRLYVDVFALSHPDRDHIAGLERHFHLGAPSNLKKPSKDNAGPEKVLIREMWSSPLTFRRKDKVDGPLCADAEAWREEARRRVKLHKAKDSKANELGNKILVLGEDIHNKTEGIEGIVVNVGDQITQIGGENDSTFSALLLSPKLVSGEEAEELKGKNNSSIVLRFSLAPEKGKTADIRFLTGGDAEIDIWKRIWERNKATKDNLAYHVLQTPHHCSLGCLSYDNYNDIGDKKGKGEDCVIDDEALSALSQNSEQAIIVASMDEPEKKSGRSLAWRTYQDKIDGQAKCTMVDSPDKPLRIYITEAGPSFKPGKKAPAAIPAKTTKGSSEQGYA